MKPRERDNTGQQHGVSKFLNPSWLQTDLNPALHQQLKQKILNLFFYLVNSEKPSVNASFSFYDFIFKYIFTFFSFCV